jgi:hypothetical protein
MEATGPTGGIESVEPEPIATTGSTGPFVTEQVGPQPIVTMEELMNSHAVIVQKEAADRASLAPLVTPTSEQYRPQLFQWAAAGFPGIYVIFSITLSPPSICADGVARDVNAYITYLTGSDMGVHTANIQAVMPGIVVSFSFEGNSARIHVSKA